MKLDKFFKQAITDGDWAKVCKVYTTITGEPIEPPKPKQEGTDWANLEIEDEAVETPKPKAAKKTKASRTGKSPPSTSLLANGKQNKFIDDGSLHADEMVTIRPDLGIKNPRPRTPSRTVNVKCRLCGGDFSVSPAFVVISDDGQKSYCCDACLTKGVKE